MRVFVIAISAAIFVAVIAYLALSPFATTSDKAFSSVTTRVGDPGHTLIGNRS